MAINELRWNQKHHKSIATVTNPQNTLRFTEIINKEIFGKFIEREKQIILKHPVCYRR